MPSSGHFGGSWEYGAEAQARDLSSHLEESQDQNEAERLSLHPITSLQLSGGSRYIFAPPTPWLCVHGVGVP